MLQNRGRFTIEEAIPLMTQACAGIGYAHRAGLVHCDIKPHNFLITPDNRLKVTDFGIARALASIHPDEQADIVWGSPQYFSPEQAKSPNLKAGWEEKEIGGLGIYLVKELMDKVTYERIEENVNQFVLEKELN